MTVSFIAPEELDDLPLLATLEPYRKFLQQLAACEHRDSSPLVANIRTTVRLLRVDDVVLPVTINEFDFDNAWVCSPFNATITYPLDELKHINSRVLRSVVTGLIHAASPILKFAQINRVVCVNNWLLSTNLYPAELFPQTRPSFNAAAVTEFLTSEFPRHAILFRSLNHVTNGPMMDALRRAGYLLAASRQVYLFDGARRAFLKHKNTRRDLKLLRETSLQRLEHHEFNDSHDARVQELYNLLYLEKYSKHNPQFTKRMIRIWRESGTMHLFGLMSDGQLCAVAGTFAMDNVITGPLIGYDTSRPPSAGLYRLLMAYTFQRALDDKLLLNLSAGAASFKRLRGGEPVLEYSAVYCHHLSLKQRAMWKSLAVLLERVGARLLRRYKL